MKNMTIKQLKKAMINNKYIVVRESGTNDIRSVNCRIMNILTKNQVNTDNNETKFIGYYPCNFMEYIRLKTPFISTEKS